MVKPWPWRARSTDCTHYPDDATQRFDFNFDIRALVAIAPVDGQYRPSDKAHPAARLSTTSSFTARTTAMCSTFNGLTQYDRISFTPGTDYFKSAIWMYRANHGQWNTGWNNKDNGPTSARRLSHQLARER